ncbi:MAG: dihydrofolate reductase [Candidatus Aenigmarchaeota archaeon]|nr:dihydrofolate reductase [Candidatus Aenigmarchaeota archaeon]
MSEIIIIAAVSENNVIGKDGKIPWNIKEDLQRFRKLTLNNPVIMGRKTYESLPVKPLKDRINIVLTRQKDFNPPGIIVKKSLEDAIEFCKNYDKVFIIGGQAVFEDGLKIADTLELTRVHKNYDGDAFFPEINFGEWVLKNKDVGEDYSFLTYVRKK